MPSRNKKSQARRASLALFQVEGITIQVAPNAVAQQALEVSLLPKPPSGAKAEALDVRG
jgi:hypothetical protein